MAFLSPFRSPPAAQKETQEAVAAGSADKGEEKLVELVRTVCRQRESVADCRGEAS